jgi:hypothetical protein
MKNARNLPCGHALTLSVNRSHWGGLLTVFVLAGGLIARGEAVGGTPDLGVDFGVGL